GVMYLFAARMYKLFDEALAQYEMHYTGSERPYYFSVFSAATFHLGNKCRTMVEDDLPWGWSALTALGNYNPDKGGHIILWDLNLVVCFPPGATILIPRTLVRYSFVKVNENESRYCLVQFTPAPVFNF
ncbi:hypothetical protein B0H15DRAFT_753351, partial [Mycena belliarum]